MEIYASGYICSYEPIIVTEFKKKIRNMHACHCAELIKGKDSGVP
jgi:hypothetical protein